MLIVEGKRSTKRHAHSHTTIKGLGQLCRALRVPLTPSCHDACTEPSHDNSNVTQLHVKLGHSLSQKNKDGPDRTLK